MLESNFEKDFRHAMLRYDVLCLKLNANSFGCGVRGIPDFFCFTFDKTKSFFVELKVGNGELSLYQRETITRLRDMGYKVYIISEEDLLSLSIIIKELKI